MLDNPDRKPVKPLKSRDRAATRDYSSDQEHRVATLLGGKVVSNSGATPFHKGDVTLEDWLLECKTTTKAQKSMKVMAEWLIGIKEEALAMRKKGYGVVISMDTETDYVVIPIKDFKRLIGNSNG